MTMVPTPYGCRNCSLVFYEGISHGPATHPNLFHYKVCRDCGWMYKKRLASYKVSHPLDGILYSRLPGFLGLNPNRNEIDVIKSAIHDDMLMLDVARIMKSLPIRKKWFSMFEYSYKKAQDTLPDNIEVMSVKSLLQACLDYDHTIERRYAETQLYELPNNGEFWKYRDDYFDLSASQQKELLFTSPKFGIKLSEELIYRESDRDSLRKEINDFFQFDGVACINCQSIGTIGYPPTNANRGTICPRCREAQIDKLLQFF
jgi:hypothetical protein